MPQSTVTYSIIIPIFDEEAVLSLLFTRLDAMMDGLDGRAEVILVDDGSRDRSSLIATERAAHDARYRYIGLSRNFGHQIAITAGMDKAQGRAIIVMDADLQDPPDVVPQMIGKWREGYDIVYARRLSRDRESRFKRATARGFYYVLRRLSNVDIPENVGDFRLIDRKVLDAFKRMPERDRFVRGMFGWLGFRHTAVDFHRDARAAGRTKYGLARMLRLAMDGIIGFSDKPLRIALWLGLAVSLVALAFGAWVVILTMLGSDLVPGWASLAVITSFLSGMNLLTVGVVGLYVGRIHNEVKQRPLYVIGREVGTDDADAGSSSSRELRA